MSIVAGGTRLQRLPDAVDAARQVVERGGIDRAGSARAGYLLIEPRRDLLQPQLDRGERRRGGGAFDLSAGFRKPRGHLGRFEMRSGARAKPLDAVGQLPDLPLQPFERRRAQRGGSQEIAHLLGLLADALESFRIDRRRREAVDPAADRADLAFEPDRRRLRVMRFQRRAEFRGHRLERSEHRFAVTALTQHLDALHEIADGALERDDGVARRKIGEAPVHRRDLGAHRAEVDRRGARLGALAAHVVELAAESPNVIEQQLRERRRGVGFDGARRRIRGGFRFWTGAQVAWIAPAPGRRGRAPAKSARPRFRSRGRRFPRRGPRARGDAWRFATPRP